MLQAVKMDEKLLEELKDNPVFNRLQSHAKAIRGKVSSLSPKESSKKVKKKKK